jgi:hypothetical protein
MRARRVALKRLRDAPKGFQERAAEEIRRERGARNLEKIAMRAKKTFYSLDSTIKT